MTQLILSLCDRSGVWSAPYAEAGYHVVMVDAAHEPGWNTEGNISRVGADVCKFDWAGKPFAVLAAPPCTCFCRPGAKHWFKMDFTGQTRRDVEVFRACLRLCQLATGWWALENPPGRLPELIPELGPPAWQYQPWEYGDAWTKQTYIWGTAQKPPVTAPVETPATRRTPNGKTQGRISFMSSSWKTKREETPAGFAAAFYEANQMDATPPPTAAETKGKLKWSVEK